MSKPSGPSASPCPTNCYVNLFLPVVKLLHKVRDGSKVKKTCDPPQTPYARVLASPDVSDEVKDKLLATYQQLDLVQLRQHLDELLQQLLTSSPDR